MTELTADAWLWAMQDVRDETFEWAAEKVVREQGRTYFPTPNELRAHVKAATNVYDTPRLASGDEGVPPTPEQTAELRRVIDQLKGKMNAKP